MTFVAKYWWGNNGWYLLDGEGKAKAETVFGERLDYSKRYGRKTVFAQDCVGVLRLRALGPSGEILQYKAHSFNEVETGAFQLALAAKTGILDEGIYSVLNVEPVKEKP